MKKLLFYLFILLVFGTAQAQSVGIGTTNPTGIFHVTNNPSDSSALFYVNTNGNVGVGTIDPQRKLEVAGGVLAHTVSIMSKSTSQQPFKIEHFSLWTDQRQNEGESTINDASPGWQSFTAGVSGILERVSLSFKTGSSYQSVLKIYAGEGTGGEELASINFSIPSTGGISVSSGFLNVPVAVGNKYTIWLSHRFSWRYSSSDIYNAGRGETASIDRRFRTYVTGIASWFNVNYAGYVGIGTDQPTEQLVVKTPSDNYGLLHTDGVISFGSFAGGTQVNGGWFGTKSNHPLLFFTNNGGAQMAIMPNGNVGIGTVAPAYKLHVSGIVAANDFVTMSDARLKKDIVPLSNALSTVLQLNGVTYYWKGESYPQYQFDTKHKIGFLAQEVEKVMPELVATGADGYKTVNYIEVVPLLVESIKQQQQQIDELKTMVKKLMKPNL